MSIRHYTSATPPVAATSTPYHIGGGICETHVFEVKITDADASITALVLDFYTSNTDRGGDDPAPASATDMFIAATHTFTAAQLARLKHAIVLTDTPARSVAVGINSVTGAGAGDQITVDYDARDLR